ncbi:MAG: 30S ribosomal protein S12 methylthiotransferase RimO [Phycisphaerae bacterium]
MGEPVRVAFVSLGCAKNLVDSEKMLGQLAEAGCAITFDEDDADAIVINTCGFLQASRDEADEVIRDAVERKARGAVRRVVVAGCLVQRDGEAIAQRVPGVDALVGVHRRDDIVRAVLGSNRPGRARAGARPDAVQGNGTSSAATRRTVSTAAPPPAASRAARGGGMDVFLGAYHPYAQTDTARLRLTPRHYAYLRISEGCDQKCTFCTIPAIRGRMHCKPPDAVVAEARELVGDGARELILIGQDTTSYGLGDHAIDGGLPGLLRRLDGVDGVRWVRLMYVYPSVLSDETLDAIAESDHVCHYIDIPLQHINDRILKAMHRRIDRDATERLLQRIRERIPDVTIRTTMIAGFPGETDAEFDELVSFVRAFRFDALGVFAYSCEPETPAGRMNGQLPHAVKEQRVEALMLAQQAVAFSLADERIGTVCDVVVDHVDAPDTVVARHAGQAPSVDGVTYVARCGAAAGAAIQVRCVGRRGYDLMARPTALPLPVIASHGPAGRDDPL